MHSQIQKLAAGKFDYELPKVRLGIEKLELSVLENTVYEGSFMIYSENHIPIRGVVYSSNPRMKCVTTAFHGQQAEIFYEFDSSGLVEDDLEIGEIYLICAYGEYKLSFSAVITKYYYKSEMGYIKKLSQFFELAKTAYHEAYQLFLSPHFKNLFRQENQKEKLYYEGFTRKRPGMREFDEFLVACGQKKRMEVSLVEDSASYENVTETLKECIILQKEGWGHLEITVETDCDFLSVEKRMLTQEDFIGSRCEAAFFIHGEKLHGGKNYGRIFFHTAFSTYSFQVCASAKFFYEGEPGRHTRIRKLKVELTKLYIDYRLNKNMTGEWVRETLTRLETLMEEEPENGWYPLLKVQTLLINKQRQDAMWLMDEWKKNFDFSNPELHAYFLYLCTLCDRDKTYVQEKTEQIKQLYRQNRESDKILWTLLFLDEEYERNKSRKLNAIRMQMQSGNTSPVLYLEAYYLMNQEAYLLNELGEFELRTLLWAVKNDCLTRTVAIQVARLSTAEKRYSPILYRVLCACGSIFPEKEIIGAICAFLIRNGLYGKDYDCWYRQGIQQDIRITLMYEYYLMSLPIINETTVPKVLQLYFQYNCHLDEQTKAKLLAFIIRNREKEPAVYEGYTKLIDEFAVLQIRQHRMDDSLRIIYEDFLQRGMIDRSLAEDFCEILFTKKLVVDCTQQQRNIVVLHSQLKGEQIVPVKNHHAYVGIYTNDFVLLYEDTYGNRYGMTDEFQTEAMLTTYKYSRTMLDIVPEQKYCLVHYFERKASCQTLVQDDMSRLYMLMAAGGIREEFKLKLLPEMFRYYMEHYTDDFLEEYLLTLDVGALLPQEKAKAVEVLIGKGYYDRAYELIVKYGDRFISPSKLISLCSYKIEQLEYECEDVLVELSYDIFRLGTYNEMILEYLLKYYCGSTKNMEAIWIAAVDFQLDTHEFEERLLVQMLFTTDYIGNMEDIFESYRKQGASSLIGQAYFSYCAYGYFVKQEEISRNFFNYLYQYYCQEEYLSEICLLALMHQLVEQKDFSGQKGQILEQLLKHFLDKKMEFAFYEKIDSRLRAKYNIHDKMYVEYRSKPDKNVTLYYIYEDDPGNEYKKIPMQHMLYGIYTASLPVFFGESVQYYITEQCDTGEDKMMASGRRGRNDVYHEAGGSRFELINNLIVSRTLKDDAAAVKYAQQYMNREIVGQEIFKIL